jgi:cerevisin
MKGLQLALACAAAASPVLFDATHNDAAPILSSQNAVEIPDSYMIMFKDHVTQNLASAHHDWVHDLHTTTQVRKTELRKRSQEPFFDEFFAGLKHTYNIAGSLLGYSGHFDEETIEQIRRHPDVSWRNNTTPNISLFAN